MDEMSPEQLFNKWQEQQNRMQHMDRSPGRQNKESLEHQRVLNEVRSSGPPAPAAPTQGDCPQCGLLHPPLPPGEKCPNAPIKLKGEDGKEINVNELVVKVKDILASQIEQRDIKNIDKFTKEMIMALMKFCEEYKE